MLKTGEKSVPVTEQEKKQPGSILPRREKYFPLLFSLTPRHLFTYSPFEMMRKFTKEMDEAFENFGLWRGFGEGEKGIWKPAVEVFEREGKFFVRAELPGLNKENIKVELTDEGLVIKGERKFEHEEKEKGFYRSEMNYGTFYRCIPLPEGADLNKIVAQFNNGVLEISVLIPEVVRKSREIPIDFMGKEHAEAAKTHK